MIEVLFRMSRSEMGQKIEFNLHIPGQIIFTNPTDKCPERQQWNMCPVYPYPTWISCWPKKKTELFLAKVKPIASLERHKLTGSVIKTRPNRWVSHPCFRGTDWQDSESQAFSFQVVLWFRVRCCCYFVFHLQSARTFANCSSQSTFLFLT